MTALIGIGGHLAAGKDTVADHLVEVYGFVKLGMSDPLNEALMTLNPRITRSQPDPDRPDTPAYYTQPYASVVKELGYVEAKKITEVRELLQRLGTDVGRQMIGENVWVDIAGRKIDKLRQEGRSVVITGLRFPNELAMIEARSGETWWIERKSQSLVSDASTAAHASEHGLNRNGFMRPIVNDGTVEALYRKIERFMVGHERAATA